MRPRTTSELTTLTISSLVTLRAGAEHLEIETTLDHHAEDFRLRLLLPVDVPLATTWHAHHPFDLVERPIAGDRSTDNWQEADLAEKPFLHLQSVSHGQRGLAFLSGGGLHEGGVADDQRRTMQVTLLRSFRSTIATGGEPDGLEPGRLTWRYGLLPFAGPLPRHRALSLVAELQTGLTTRQSGARPSGYLPLPASGVTTRSYLAQLDHQLIVSAIKPAEDGQGLIVRLWNPSDEVRSERLRLDRPITHARVVSLAEEPLITALLPLIDGQQCTISAPPRGIVSVYLRCG